MPTELEVPDASFEDCGVLADEFLDLFWRVYADETASFVSAAELRRRKLQRGDVANRRVRRWLDNQRDVPR